MAKEENQNKGKGLIIFILLVIAAAAVVIAINTYEKPTPEQRLEKSMRKHIEHMSKYNN